MPKATRRIFGRLNVKKANKKYGDVITGTWEDTQEEGGIWNIDGRPEIQGYFVKNYETATADLYIDSNGNLEPDDGDLIVGIARVAEISTGGYGTWNWSSGMQQGDYFGYEGQDAGQFKLTNTSFF